MINYSFLFDGHGYVVYYDRKEHALCGIQHEGVKVGCVDNANLDEICKALDVLETLYSNEEHTVTIDQYLLIDILLKQVDDIAEAARELVSETCLLRHVPSILDKIYDLGLGEIGYVLSCYGFSVPHCDEIISLSRAISNFANTGCDFFESLEEDLSYLNKAICAYGDARKKDVVR